MIRGNIIVNGEIIENLFCCQFFEHAQNDRFRRILRMRKESYGHFLSNDSFSGPGAMINPQWLSGPKNVRSVQWNALPESAVCLPTLDAFKEEVGKLHNSRP